MITDFLNMLGGAVFDFLDGLLGIFPAANVQVQDFLTATGMTAQMLGWINWFLPLDIASSILALWAVSMLAYLGIKMAMRYSGELT